MVNSEPPELRTSPEKPKNIEQMTAVHGRFLLALKTPNRELINPDNTKIPDVSEDQFEKDIGKQDFSLFTNASTQERAIQSGVTADKLSQAVEEWAVHNTQEIKNKMKLENSSRWNTTLAKLIGKQTMVDFNENDLKTLFQTYFTGGKESKVQEFVAMVRTQFSSREETLANLDCIEWFSHFFGDKSAEMVRELVVAEERLEHEPELVQTLNTKNPSTKKSRIDEPDKDKEVSLLRFVYGNGELVVSTEPAKTVEPEPIISDEFVQSALDEFHKRIHHPRSQDLPENNFTDDLDYVTYYKKLPKYQVKWDDVFTYDEKNPGNIKHDHTKTKTTQVGWKLHLNVQPEHVQEVSQYLSQNGYAHKFLYGGDIQDGSVFTVYTGAYRLTSECAGQLSTDLHQFLSRPTNQNELEFAPGVVGRFQGPKGGKDGFADKGPSGFSLTEDSAEYWLNILKYHKQDPDYQERVEQQKKISETTSFKKLYELYGGYFYEKPDSLLENNVNINDLEKLKEMSQHNLSVGLPTNSYIKSASDADDGENFIRGFEQLANIREYQFVDDRPQLLEYEAKHPKEKKRDYDTFGFDGLRSGWKLHLNVTAENSKAVADYLIQNGYVHKFLSDGRVSQGKTFTIYIGSRNLTEKLALQLSQDLSQYLSLPVDHREVEFARGVVGRFTALDRRAVFDQYGQNGIPNLQPDFNHPEKIASQEESYRKLQKLYGDYFTGIEVNPPVIDKDLPQESISLIESISPDIPDVFKEQAVRAAQHIHRLVNNQWESHPDTVLFVDSLFEVSGFHHSGFFNENPYVQYKKLEHEIERLTKRLLSPRFSADDQQASRQSKIDCEKQLAAINVLELEKNTPAFLKNRKLMFKVPLPRSHRLELEFLKQYFQLGKDLGYSSPISSMESNWVHASNIPSTAEAINALAPLNGLLQNKLYIQGENLDALALQTCKSIFQELGSNVYLSKVGGSQSLVLYCPDEESALKAKQILASHKISARGPAQDDKILFLHSDGTYESDAQESNDILLSSRVLDPLSGKVITAPNLDGFKNLSDYDTEFLRRWLLYCYRLNRAPDDPFSRSYLQIVLETGLDPNSTLVQEFQKKLIEGYGMESHIAGSARSMKDIWGSQLDNKQALFTS